MTCAPAITAPVMRGWKLGLQGLFADLLGLARDHSPGNEGMETSRSWRTG